ncbi:hypothetical protein ACTQ1N_03920 [Porcincola sp. LCP21S3_C12]|jgi:hypothetical protein|uniref:hypothetical protein n=1 Tax=Porcincola sp. LCP21S3_C12 TaxID=3438798 RepID=UPI003F988E93
MSIIWKYLDKRSATVAAIKDYHSMEFIINNTAQDIIEEKNRMTGIGSPTMDGMPHSHNPQAGEERILTAIEEIDVLKERYRQAVEYMDWFQPAWDQLSEDEKYTLQTFYDDEIGMTGAVYDICDHFHIERSSAYNKKNRALTHLQILLFGKD